MAGLVAGTGKAVGMITRPSLYHRHRFPGEIISHAVWLYHLLSLSLSDIEGRAVEINAFARIDLALAVKRQVIAILRHQKMGERRLFRRCLQVRARRYRADLFRTGCPTSRFAS
jgi:hypothetical protein